MDLMEDESNDEDYIPENNSQDFEFKKLKKRSYMEILRNLNSELKISEKEKLEQIKKDKSKSFEEIYQEGLRISKNLIKKNPVESTKTYSFADKFYVLINNSFLKEIEKKPQEVNNLKQSINNLNYEELLDEKNKAVQELIQQINESKAKTLTSILKSKYDWKHYISQEKIEQKLQYLRKDDLTFKKLGII